MGYVSLLTLSFIFVWMGGNGELSDSVFFVTTLNARPDSSMGFRSLWHSAFLNQFLICYVRQFSLHTCNRTMLDSVFVWVYLFFVSVFVCLYCCILCFRFWTSSPSPTAPPPALPPTTPSPWPTGTCPPPPASPPLPSQPCSPLCRQPSVTPSPPKSTTPPPCPRCLTASLPVSVSCFLVSHTYQWVDHEIYDYFSLVSGVDPEICDYKLLI